MKHINIFTIYFLNFMRSKSLIAYKHNRIYIFMQLIFAFVERMMIALQYYVNAYAHTHTYIRVRLHLHSLNRTIKMSISTDSSNFPPHSFTSYTFLFFSCFLMFSSLYSPNSMYAQFNISILF